MTEAQAQARSSLAERCSELEVVKREHTNLTTINTSLSVRIDTTQSKLSRTEARLQALTAQRTAEQREAAALQAMMTARLADKEALIDSLQQRMAELSSDSEAPVANDIDDV